MKRTRAMMMKRMTKRMRKKCQGKGGNSNSQTNLAVTSAMEVRTVAGLLEDLLLLVKGMKREALEPTNLRRHNRLIG